MNRKEATGHNLDIKTYSLSEILDLYDLPSRPSLEQMKRARNKMLMTHPDKSKLGPEYFIFYRKAYDTAVQYFNDLNRQSQPVVNRDYEAPPVLNQEQISKAANASEGKFNNQFNRLFEEQGGVDKQRQDKQAQRFGWFSQADTGPPVKDVKSASGINDAFESMRPNQVVVHKEFAPLKSRSGAYIDEEEDDEQADAGYIESDPFSKLKFADIRRVHKDQTVLPVGESDFQKMSTYKSVEEYKKARESQTLESVDKSRALNMLKEQEAAEQRLYEQRWSRVQQRTQQHESNNNNVLSSFMLLTGSNNANTRADTNRGTSANTGTNANTNNRNSSSSSSSSAGYINKARTSCMRF